MTTREEVLQTIIGNQSIADVSALQGMVSRRVPCPEHIEHQQEKMRTHWSFLEILTRGHERLSLELRQARAQLECSSMTASNEALLQFFADLFAEGDLWSQWVQYL